MSRSSIADYYFREVRGMVDKDKKPHPDAPPLDVPKGPPVDEPEPADGDPQGPGKNPPPPPPPPGGGD